jgi:uncharacterized protein (TIGR04551 family)
LYLPYGTATGQALDAVDWDDVNEYSLRVQRLDHPDDIKQELSQGGWVLNYGLWASWRVQYRDLGDAYYIPDATQPTVWDYDPARLIDHTVNPSYEERRDANVVSFDAFGRFYWGKLKIGLEGVFTWGQYRDQVIAKANAQLGSSNLDAAELKRATQILSWGFALEASYKLPDEYAGVNLLLKAGVASGDSAPGFGTLDQTGSQHGIFGGKVDSSIENFQFNPNYHVDYLMFRNILGTVSDAWYVSPGASYDVNESININGNVTYSNAIYKRSTQSCYDPTQARCPDEGGEQGAREMGLEFDAEASWGMAVDPDGNSFRAAIRGGLVFPFGAFQNPLGKTQPLQYERGQGPNFAWMIGTRLNITF